MFGLHSPPAATPAPRRAAGLPSLGAAAPSAPSAPSAPLRSRARAWRAALAPLAERLAAVGLAAVGLAAVGLAAVGCDADGVKTSQSGLLLVTPETVTFPVLGAGQEQTRPLTLENIGSADVLISAVAMEQPRALFRVSREGEEGGVEGLTLPAGGAPLRLMVTYAADGQPLRGDEALVLRTNVRSQGDLRVPLRTSDARPELIASPSALTFESLDVGEEAVERTTLRNVGSAPLSISALTLTGEFFTATLEGGARDGETIAPGESLALALAESEAQVVAVRYAPLQARVASGALQVVSDDPISPNLLIPIAARGAAPCIQVTPDFVEFGAGLLLESRAQETPNVRRLLVESCGGSELKVTRAEFEGEAFGWAEEPALSPEGLLVQLPGAAPESPFPAAELAVGFWPSAEMSYGGRLKLYTNTSLEPLVVDLFGLGVANACPVPAATLDRYDVAPLDVITLDGSPSSDPGGEVRRWVWAVVERPSGSVSRVVESFTSPVEPAAGGEPDDELTPRALFFVDLAGRYTLELRVFDNLGQESCAPRATALVEVEAVPQKDLHIQLVWATPADPDETDDKGTDVDLHLKHQTAGAAWGGAAGVWDCYFRNKAPDWGAVGDFLDDPSLDIDDINGAGPENVNLNRPEVGVTYEVGALYFRAESTFGEAGRDPRIEHQSYVTTRVFARGELVAELVDRELSAVNQLWHALSVTWCADEARCPEITPQDRVYEDGEYGN